MRIRPDERHTTRRNLPTIAIVLAAGILYLLAMDGNKLGFYHDDGVYVVAAKSLAEGSGYRALNLPGEPKQIKYPPLYPAFLSLLWWTNPRFPSNAVLIFLPSVISTLLYLCISREFLVKELSAGETVATLSMAFVAYNSRTLLLASGALSEAFFTLVSIAALWAVSVHLKRPSVRTGTVSSLLLAATILTRSSGIALLAAIGIFAMLQRKLLRVSGVFVIGALAFVVWTLWTHLGNDTFTAQNYYYGSYLRTFQEQVAPLGSGGFALIVAKNAFMLIPVSIPIVSLGLSYAALAGLSPHLVLPALLVLFLTFGITLSSFIQSVRGNLHLIHIYVGCYLLLHVFWPYPVYDRFLMPLLPFLSFFLIDGIVARVKGLSVPSHRLVRRLAPLLMALCVGFWLYINGTGIWQEVFQSREPFAVRRLNDEEIAAWIQKNTEPGDMLLCYPDPLCYLSSNRKAVSAEFSVSNPSDRESLIRGLIAVDSQYIIDNDAARLALFRPDLSIGNFHEFLRSRPDLFTPVFSTDQTIIYRQNPAH